LYEACLEWVFSPAYVSANRAVLDKLKTFFRLTVQDSESFCQQSLAGTRHDAGRYLAAVPCPTLVVHGGADRLVTPELGRSWPSPCRTRGSRCWKPHHTF
jgi:hypothetical protein